MLSLFLRVAACHCSAVVIGDKEHASGPTGGTHTSRTSIHRSK